MWSTVIIREMFHHYLFNAPAYRAYANKIRSLGYDSRDLKKLAQRNPDILRMMNRENGLLMNAIENADSRDRLVRDDLSEREERIGRSSAPSPHFEKVENYYIKQEGSIRYAEYPSNLAMNRFLKGGFDIRVKKDPLFSDFEDFRNFSLENRTSTT